MNLWVKAHPYLSIAVMIWAAVITLLLVAIQRDFANKESGDLYLVSSNNERYYPQQSTSSDQIATSSDPAKNLYE